MSQSGSFGQGTVPGGVVETLTGNTGGPVGPTAGNIDIVGVGTISVTGNPGASTLTISSTAVAAQFDGDTGTAVPSAGILNIIGGAGTAGINIHTSASGNTVEIILNDSILMPSTNGSGSEGVIFWNGNRFISQFGTNNTFLGSNSGSFTLSGSENAGFGSGVLTDITSGSFNVAGGVASLAEITSGSDNCCLGTGSFTNLLTGSNNSGLGSNTGSAYTGAESNNILIGNNVLGDVGESAFIRIGDPGTITHCFVGGIFNVTPPNPTQVVLVNNNGQLGSSTGTNGQILIGATGGSAAWENITSTGATVAITNGPNSINLEVEVAVSTFPTDSGTAIPAGGALTIHGGSNINTSGLGSTVTIDLDTSILQPNTNTSGSQGLYSLGGNRFLHNFGTNNTFIGSQSGNLTLTGSDNCGTGSFSLTSLTSGSSNNSYGSTSLDTLQDGINNSCYGDGSFRNLVSGNDNCGLGFRTGGAYTSTESNNISIGSNVSGTTGESNTIRIGDSITSTFIDGIFGETVGVTNAQVIIDNTGKLGTVGAGGSAEAFLVFLPAPDGPYANSTSILRPLGVNVILNVISDNGGNFFPGAGGGGAAAEFTAPVTGLYQITFACSINFSGSAATIYQNTITTTNRTYSLNLFPANVASPKSNISTVSADMTAGDTAQFGIIAAVVNSGGWSYNPGQLMPFATSPTLWISGFKIN